MRTRLQWIRHARGVPRAGEVPVRLRGGRGRRGLGEGLGGGENNPAGGLYGRWQVERFRPMEWVGGPEAPLPRNGYGNYEMVHHRVPGRGLYYVSDKNAREVIEAERLSRRKERKGGSKKGDEKGDSLEIPEYVPVLVGFDRIELHRWLPRLQGVIVKEAEYESKYKPLQDKWGAIWDREEKQRAKDKAMAFWFFYIRRVVAHHRLRDTYQGWSSV